jgi:hypothetical protein
LSSYSTWIKIPTTSPAAHPNGETIDVAFLVARALQRHLAKIDLRLQFTDRRASILFSLSLNTSPLQEAWKAAAQAIAPSYAEHLLIDSVRSGNFLPGPSPRSTGKTHLTLIVPSPHTSRKWEALYLRKMPLSNSSALISSRKRKFSYTKTRIMSSPLFLA